MHAAKTGRSAFEQMPANRAKRLGLRQSKTLRET